MTVIDRHHVLDTLPERGPVVLELGCGEQRKRRDAIGIDQRDLPEVDLVGDIFEVLGKLPDDCAGEVVSWHFLEHVDDLPRLFAELARVVREGGRVESVVPHFSNPYFYSDYTHVRPFGLYSFSYFATDRLLKRRVPHYGVPLPFELESLRLEFRSPKAFPLRRFLRRRMTPLVNASVWTQEFYEENLSHIFPCYEVKAVLRRTAG